MEREKGTTVRILEKEFKINCAPNQTKALADAADYLDAKMRQIRLSGRVIGLERVAIMAALHITHELLSLKNQAQPEEEVVSLRERLQALQHKIDDALAETSIPYGKMGYVSETRESLELAEEY